ncbi:MAG: T9SS type A sorting domain-containing protein [Bacteroidetes bacterium]|nr:T9SS type A sorting domain-containing protein [Bacteroidota bacterium]
MNKNIFFSLSVLSLLLIVMLSDCELSAQSKINDRRAVENSLESRTRDNPFARQKLEWLQLRNPATGRIPSNIREKELRFAKTLPTKENLLMKKGRSKNSQSVQSYNWTQRGPYNIGGRTRALALDVNNDNTILAGGVNGGMWKSTDDGASWSEKTSPGDLQSVTCVAQDTRTGKTNTWYYGTGEFDPFLFLGAGTMNSASGGFGFDSTLTFLGDGIFKSTDDGNSWAVMPSTLTLAGNSTGPFSVVYNIVTNHANLNQDEVLAATMAGIMRSTNGGVTWDTTLPELFGIYSNIAVTSKGIFYAELSYGAFPLLGGIFRSTDGVNWTDITPNSFPINITKTAIGIAPSDENVVYFLSDTSSGGTDGHVLWKYTFLSGDGSGSNGNWEDCSPNLPSEGHEGLWFDSGWGYSLCISVKPDDENTVFLGEIGLFRSTNGFSSSLNTTAIGDTQGYAVRMYKTIHTDNHIIIFSKTNPNIMYVGNDGGVFKTIDDMDSPPEWTSLNNGYYTTQFYAVAIDHVTTDDIIIAGSQDNGTVFTNSNSATYQWKDISEGDGYICYIADNGSSYYTSEPQGFIERLLLDNDGNITSIGYIEPLYYSVPIAEPYTIDPNDNKVMYCAEVGYLWRNSDVTAIPMGNNGTTDINWTKLANSSTNSIISTIEISKSPANRVYYGTMDGKIFRLDDANSASSIPIDIYSNKGLPSGAYVYSIAVDQNDGDKAIACFSNYWIKSLFYTTDAGNTWTSISGNLEQNPDGSGDGPSTRWVKILPINGSNIYFVGTSTGVYSTTSLNGDKTVWALEGANSIGNAVVDAIDARSTDGLVVVATHGKGIFSTHINSGSVIDTSGILLSYDNNNPQTGAYETQPNNNWILANRLTAPNNAFKIDKLIYYVNGDDSTGTASFYPVVYSGSITFFGMPSNYPTFTGQLFTPVKGWNTIDISSSNITNPNTSGNDFFLGVKYDGKDEPLIGLDTVSNGRGWEYNPVNSSWTQLDNYKPPFPATLYIRAVVSEVTGIVEIDNKVPKNFSLAQNYPNPFNPTTTIQYDLPKSENVKLKVYDILGREVAALVDAYQAAGTYKVQWNGRNDRGESLASGIYLYTFEAGSFKSVKKMIYLK